MATTSEAWVFKSLNKSSGSRRFVFKSFFQRLVEEKAFQLNKHKYSSDASRTYKLGVLS
ncbi:uncharacterized protein LOC122671063 [Telopea speciosissima]|uniref:uncharacterized protein LOC122671063 n=1 Tax=Telopea speciosissima TaxID=54955 RepID=UPI001CC4C9DE|nr:uncharacterized protein LOC122671063 [Telopea speciosissima]